MISFSTFGHQNYLRSAARVLGVVLQGKWTLWQFWRHAGWVRLLRSVLYYFTIVCVDLWFFVPFKCRDGEYHKMYIAWFQRPTNAVSTDFMDLRKRMIFANNMGTIANLTSSFHVAICGSDFEWVRCNGECPSAVISKQRLSSYSHCKKKLFWEFVLDCRWMKRFFFSQFNWCLLISAM